MDQREFFNESTESQRYKLSEVIGKGSYGVVASATDQFTGAYVWVGGGAVWCGVLAVGRAMQAVRGGLSVALFAARRAARVRRT